MEHTCTGLPEILDKHNELERRVDELTKRMDASTMIDYVGLLQQAVIKETMQISQQPSHHRRMFSLLLSVKADIKDLYEDILTLTNYVSAQKTTQPEDGETPEATKATGENQDN